MAQIVGSTSNPNLQAPNLLRLLKKVKGQHFKSLATKDGVLKRMLDQTFVNLEEQAVDEINNIEDIIQVIGLRRELLDVEENVADFLHRHRPLIFRPLSIRSVQYLKKEKVGKKIWRLINSVVEVAEERIRSAKKMVISKQSDFNTAVFARDELDFKGKLFFSKKLAVFDAALMIESAMSTYGFTLNKLRVSSQLGITISEAGVTIDR